MERVGVVVGGGGGGGGLANWRRQYSQDGGLVGAVRTYRRGLRVGGLNVLSLNSSIQTSSLVD